ncbi:MAG TPA: non-heme iron oxygenase ferredoxin subunit [Microbacteriaceae bacterium]|nr:non-heme iron oxygenase ferredoxin subunit [Microbacteriaceae bacterium]
MTAVEVATLDELAPNEAKRVELDGVAIAIVRDGDGAIHAIGDRCSHGEVSLSDGFVEDCTIECWAHGAKFDLRTGEPLSLPAYEPVPVFQVVIADGVVLVDPQVTIDQRAHEAQNAQEA